MAKEFLVGDKVSLNFRFCCTTYAIGHVQFGHMLSPSSILTCSPDVYSHSTHLRSPLRSSIHKALGQAYGVSKGGHLAHDQHCSASSARLAGTPASKPTSAAASTFSILHHWHSVLTTTIFYITYTHIHYVSHCITLTRLDRLTEAETGKPDRLTEHLVYFD